MAMNQQSPYFRRVPPPPPPITGPKQTPERHKDVHDVVGPEDRTPPFAPRVFYPSDDTPPRPERSHSSPPFPSPPHMAPLYPEHNPETFEHERDLLRQEARELQERQDRRVAQQRARLDDWEANVLGGPADTPKEEEEEDACKHANRNNSDTAKLAAWEAQIRQELGNETVHEPEAPLLPEQLIERLNLSEAKDGQQNKEQHSEPQPQPEPATKHRLEPATPAAARGPLPHTPVSRLNTPPLQQAAETPMIQMQKLPDKVELNPNAKKSTLHPEKLAFDSNLWDCFERASTHVKANLRTCKLFSAFLKQRASIEESYANALTKASRDLVQRCSKKDDQTVHGTQWNAFQLSVELSGQATEPVKTLVATLISELAKPLEDFWRFQTANWKALHQQGVRQQKELQDALNHRAKMKQQYEKLEADALSAQCTYEAAAKDRKPNIQKLLEKGQNASQKAMWAKSELAASTRTANQVQSKHFDVDMKATLQALEALDREITTTLRLFQHRYSVAQMEVPQRVHQHFYAPVHSAIEQIDPATDRAEFIRRAESHLPRPKPLEDPQ